MPNYWKKFESMGTEIILSAELPENEKNIIEDAQKYIQDFSVRFSRFIDNNELGELNGANGRKIEGSPLMLDFLRQMKEFHQLTGGIFDPTIIGTLENLGYDRDFALIENGTKRKTNITEINKRHFERVPFSALHLDGRTAQAPSGFRVDSGGSGKGFIVDQTAQKLFSQTDNFWISAGGDILARGQGESGFGWEISVEDPKDPDENIFTLDTHGEELGVATSGVIKRKWSNGEKEYHHIIDPRSGSPVKNDILSVTAVARTASRADIFAKTVLILGEEVGLEFISRYSDAECIIFFKNKPPHISRGMYKYIK